MRYLNGLTKLFVLIGSHILFEFKQALAQKCEKINDCSCRKSNGKIISLEDVDGGSKGPAFKGIPTISPTGSAYAFNWNPCTKFTESESGCQNVLVCQYNSNAPEETHPCASKVSEFQVNSDGSTSIIYQPYTSDLTRVFKITLVCNKNEYPGQTTGVKETQQSDQDEPRYSMTFKSKCACEDGCTYPENPSSHRLSTGSILLIVFFALLSLYLAGGIVIKKYKVGVQSMPEMLPNYDFWAQFPSLMKDGVLFSIKGLKSGYSFLRNKFTKNGYAKI
ncbi:cation-dependent mannose-6-phosphate receptor-like [Acropora palmata]|uniref:cation-dependent mannose-6-phosphate receptor-like n=1 Tax=Acropora palmata TaxID=6131 RepID=UPI003DA044FF